MQAQRAAPAWQRSGGAGTRQLAVKRLSWPLGHEKKEGLFLASLQDAQQAAKVRIRVHCGQIKRLQAREKPPGTADLVLIGLLLCCSFNLR